MAVAGTLVLAVLAVVWRPLMFASLDAEVAAARGVPVRALGLVFMVLLGCAVALSVQVVGALLVLAFAVDFFASILGAKRVGASPKALIGAGIGGFIGVFFGLPGILLGPFIGAVVGELIARGGFAQAAKVGIGTWLGLVVAAVAKLVIAFLMIGIFAAFYAANS